MGGSKIRIIWWSHTCSIRQSCGPALTICAHKRTKEGRADDTRRDLELKIVAWGRIEGGDRSELSRTRICSGWWAEFYPDTTSSRGGRGTTRSIKGGAERTTDQRAHKLSSLKSRAQEFRKQGGAQEGFAEPDKEAPNELIFEL